MHLLWAPYLPPLSLFQDNQQFQQQLHQIQHYTGQLAKDTSKHLHDMNSASSSASGGEQRQWRLQRERLHNDFTKALNSFQVRERRNANFCKDDSCPCFP